MSDTHETPIYADESRPVEERLAAAEVAMRHGDENGARWAMYLKTRMATSTEVRSVAVEQPQQLSSLEELQARIAAKQHPSQQPLTGQKMGEEPPGTLPNRSTAKSGIATPGEGFGSVVSHPAPLDSLPGETLQGLAFRYEDEGRWQESLQTKVDDLAQRTRDRDREWLQSDTTGDGDGS